MTEMEAMHGPNMHPTYQSFLSTTATKYTMCQQQRTMLSSKHGTIPLEYQLAPAWKAQWFFLTGIDSYSKYSFVYPAHRA